MSGEIESIDRNGVREDTFHFPPWTISAHQSHILHSKCSAPVVCQKFGDDADQKCLFCQFERKLPNLPSFPDMTFPRNKLSITHDKFGYGLEFNCLDALKTVKRNEDGEVLEVGVADAWKEARSDCQFSKRILKKFDWTFGTDYMATLIPASDGNPIIVEDTNQTIDMERLKTRDEILYYESIDLYEDELADHGVAKMDVKIRVMKDCFYILMRYFLRVDHIVARVQDVRIFHDKQTDFMLRDFTRREMSLKDTQNDIPVEVLNDPVQLSTRLPLVLEQKHKLIFPAV